MYRSDGERINSSIRGLSWLPAFFFSLGQWVARAFSHTLSPTTDAFWHTIPMLGHGRRSLHGVYPDSAIAYYTTYLLERMHQVIRFNLEHFNLWQLLFFGLLQHHVQSRGGRGCRCLGRRKSSHRSSQEGRNRTLELHSTIRIVMIWYQRFYIERTSAPNDDRSDGSLCR